MEKSAAKAFLIAFLIMLGLVARVCKMVNRYERSQRRNVYASAPKLTPSVEPFLQRRANFHSQLTSQGPAPFGWEPEELLDELQLVNYQSGGINLKAALYVPPNTGNQKRPALIFYHGGFSLGYKTLYYCQAFINEGFVIMMPMLRGENGCPGNYELFAGEIDDAANAAKWLANHLNVDSNNIYAFGHSIGGGVSAMLSLMDNVPLKHTGSSGGLYSTEIISDWGYEDPDVVRFNPKNEKECQMRLLISNVNWMKRKHYAYIGNEDIPFESAVAQIRQEASQAGKSDMLQVFRPSGDHFSSLEPAISQYFQVVLRDVKNSSVAQSPVAPSEPIADPPDHFFEPTEPKPVVNDNPFETASDELEDKQESDNPFETTSDEQVADDSDFDDPFGEGNKNGEANVFAEASKPDVAADDFFADSSATKKSPFDDASNMTAENNRSQQTRNETLGRLMKNTPTFEEDVPANAVLVGFEVTLKPWGAHDCIASLQPLYRDLSGTKQAKGTQHGKTGNKGSQRVYAPQGYAVIGYNGRFEAAVHGFELVYARLNPDGTLDPGTQKTSEWVGSNQGMLKAKTFSGGKKITKISGSLTNDFIGSLTFDF